MVVIMSASTPFGRLDPYSVIIFVLSLIGLVLVTSTNFAGFWLENYYTGSRYSCLTCEYSTEDRSIEFLTSLSSELFTVITELQSLRI